MTSGLNFVKALKSIRQKSSSEFGQNMRKLSLQKENEKLEKMQGRRLKNLVGVARLPLMWNWARTSSLWSGNLRVLVLLLHIQRVSV